MAVLTREGVEVHDEQGHEVERDDRYVTRPRHVQQGQPQATSWPRKSMSSRKWSVTPLLITSTWSKDEWRCRGKLPFDWKK